MKKLTPEEELMLIEKLRDRFEKNPDRHKGISWNEVVVRLTSASEKLFSLAEMERTGGEPDVVGHDEITGEILFFDCVAESPLGRRSLCFDQEALDSRKENKPVGSAIALANQMGISILDENQYRLLQSLGKFDLKTSSWIQTPISIRKLGGALFCDRRYENVFVYHNGASSYYAARGFRGCLRV